MLGIAAVPGTARALQSVLADKIRVFRLFCAYARLFPLFSAVFRGTAAIVSFAFYARSTQERSCDGIDRTRYPHHCRPCSAFSND
jgi:hypothetical protein